MKNLMLILAIIAVAAAAPLSAQEQDQVKNKKLEEQVAHDVAAEYMKQGNMVLMAESLSTPYGVDTDPNPREAFVSLEDSIGHFQIHPAGQVYEGNVSGLQLSEKRNGSLTLEFRINNSGNSGRTAKVYVQMKKGSNRGTATIVVEDNMTNHSQASFVGRIHPTNATPYPVIKGFIKPVMGKWMDPFAPIN